MQELPKYLPTADELPCSDDTPWTTNCKKSSQPTQINPPTPLERPNGLVFGIDMGIYYHPERPPIVPDGFLSLKVERFFDEELRLSYLLWEEQVPPILVLEVVSTKRRGEYTTKVEQYAQMGVLYYVIYNPKRKRKAKLEVYKLGNSEYQLQDTNPLWMPEIGLGIG